MHTTCMRSSITERSSWSLNRKLKIKLNLKLKLKINIKLKLRSSSCPTRVGKRAACCSTRC